MSEQRRRYLFLKFGGLWTMLTLGAAMGIYSVRGGIMVRYIIFAYLAAAAASVVLPLWFAKEKKRMLWSMLGGMLSALAALGLVLSHYLFVATGPPPPRPDLVRLPEGAPPAPAGYRTQNLALAAGMLGLEAIDPYRDWAVPEGIEAHADLVYAAMGERQLKLDLFKPAQLDEPAPAVVCIHGGSWARGSKRRYTYAGLRLAERGYVAVAINYRLSGEAGFPAAVQDANCAIRWVRAHADTYQIDPDRVAVMGRSAGGHLALMAAYAPAIEELEGTGGWHGQSSRPNAVISLYGPADATWPRLRDLPVAREFMKVRYDDAPERYLLASPYHHLDASDPPTLLIHGATDHVVPVGQSDKLVEKLRELGISHYYARMDGWPHALDYVSRVSPYVIWLIDSFLRETFELPPAER